MSKNTEFTHKVISSTSLQSEVGIAGGYSKEWVATKPTSVICPYIHCTKHIY